MKFELDGQYTETGPVIFSSIILGLGAGVMSPAAHLKKSFIFRRAPFASCHASTIVQTQQGRLLAAWFGGDYEGAPNVGIWLSEQTDKGWTKPREVAKPVIEDFGEFAGRTLPCYNPVLFQPSAGPLLLFYKIGPDPADWWGMVKSSTDEGRTWSIPRQLPNGILGPIKDKPIEWPLGRVLCPSSEEKGGWRIHFEWTDDGGRNWARTPSLNDPHIVQAIQPTILHLGGSRLGALVRTKERYVYSTDSDDDGKSWTALRATDLPNPDSGIDAVTLSDGRQLVVYNDSQTLRSPLVVAISEDGDHWRQVAILEKGPGEFSYPAVIQSADGAIHITYTWNRRRIVHAIVILDPGS